MQIRVTVKKGRAAGCFLVSGHAGIDPASRALGDPGEP